MTSVPLSWRKTDFIDNSFKTCETLESHASIEKR
jgi:hypothetical protein